jgi:hypothetical protein
MYDTTYVNNPFESTIDPGTVLQRVEQSAGIAQLQRRVFARADKLRGVAADLMEHDAKIEALFANGPRAGAVPKKTTKTKAEA